MGQQQTGKRSIALPITLVLLVFSLIGNVFLYSQFLQNKQQNNFETGQKIYAAAVQSKQYFEELIPLLDALLQSNQLETRAETKFLAGKASQKGQAYFNLMTEAELIAGKSEKRDAEQALKYVNEVEEALQAIGNNPGTLKEEERAYLVALKGSLEEMARIMDSFNTNIGENRVAVIRLSSGLEWIVLVEKLQQVMSGQTTKLPAA
ncbi:hypothetical protein [Paenibacillus prosopidis]|uniref:Uncharacterized protein n=1 Tax=Paenibacillus prosopidis TaxID=630520 RepID=A0A368WBP4_9BACL|nr:hypothetical protein [Paenibacillus prosopidis]RCW51300.1 hypothetical protein DFP97_102498 [Paenibacillus prosopidis]